MISEQVVLDSSGVVSSAKKAAAAVDSLTASLRAVGGIKFDSGIAEQLAGITKAVEAEKAAAAIKVAEGKAAAQIQVQDAKAAHAQKLADIKAAIAAEAAGQKTNAAAGLAAQKGQIAAQLADQKAAAAANLAQQKAIQQAILAGQKNGHAIQQADAKAAAAAEQQKLKLIQQQVKEEEKVAAAAQKAASAHAPGGGGGGGAAAPAGMPGGAGSNPLDSLLGAGADVAGWVGIIKSVWGTIFSQISSLLQGSIGLTLAAQSFKDDALDSFEILLGGEKAASAAYDKIIKLSHSLGLSREKAIAETKRLLSAGYDMKDVPRMLEAIADLDMTREGGGAKLEKIIETIKAKGKLDKGAISQLTKLGVGEEEVYKQLAKSQGKTVDEVKAMVKTGQIDANKGIDAVLGAVEGKFGGRAKKDAEDVLTLMMVIKDQLFELFDSVDIGPLQEVLKGVRDMFDSDLGKGLKDSLTEMMGALFEAIFGPFKDKSAMEGIVGGITGAIKGITEFIKSITPSIRAFVTQFESGFAKIYPVVALAWGIVSKFFSLLGGQAALAGIIGRALGLVVGIIAAVAGALTVFVGILGATIGAVVGFVAAVIVVFEQFWTFSIEALVGIGTALNDGLNSFADAANEAVAAGKSIVDGIIEGLSVDAIIAKVVSMGEAIISTIRRVLKINSPSKVFEEIGGYTAEGMEEGIDGGAGGVVSAVNRMGTAAAGQAIKIPGATAAGAAQSEAANGNGKGGDTYYVEIHANDAAGGEAAAEAFQKRMIQFKRQRVAEG